MSLPDAPNTLREKYYSVMAGQNDADILPDIETAPSTENRYLDYLARNGGGGSGDDEVWLGTRAEHTAAETAGTLPETAIIGITDESGSVVQSDWNQTDSTADDYIKNKPTIPDITGKADKVSSATSGNFAGLDSNGNLTDSGKKASDFVSDASYVHTDNNYTTAEKTKLGGIATGATANTVINTSCTLTVAGWTGSAAPYTQTVNVTGVLATDKAWVDLSVSSTVSTGLDEIDDWALISKIESGSGTLTFSCYEDKPTVALTANVKVVR